MSTTVFSITFSDYKAHKNYLGPYSLFITSGEIIPASAEITNISFSCKFTAKKNVSGYFYLSSTLPTYQGNVTPHDSSYQMQEPSEGGLWLTETKKISVSSDTTQTYEFEPKTLNGILQNTEYYKETNSFIVYLTRLRYLDSSTNYTIASVSSGYTFTCVVEWNDTTANPIFPESFYFSKDNEIITEAAIGETINLIWTPATLPSHATNEIKGYRIAWRRDELFFENNWNYYSLNDEGSTYIPASSGNITIPITLPLTSGVQYYTLEIDAGNNRYIQATNSEQILKLKIADITKIGSPANLKANGATQLYIGTINIPEIVLTWAVANDGINNPVINQKIQKSVGNVVTNLKTIEPSINTYTFQAQEVSTADYYIIANPTIPAYGDETPSNSVNITQITTQPTLPLLPPSKTVTVTTDPTISWGQVQPVTGTTVEYWIYKNSVLNSNLLEVSTLSSYTFNLNENNIQPGESFKLVVQPRYNATHGGYTLGPIYVWNYIRAGQFSLPEDFWQIIYDNTNIINRPLTGTLYNYAHQSLLLEWKEIDTSVNSNSGQFYTYQLELQINSGAFNKIAEYSTSDALNGVFSHSLSLNEYAEGTLFTFRIKIINEYNMVVYSANKEVTKIISPILQNLSISKISSSTIQPYFEWKNGNLPIDNTNKLSYSITLLYNNSSSIINSGELPINQNWYETTASISLANANLTGALKALQDALIYNQIACPKCIIQVKIWYKNYLSTMVSNSLNNVVLNYSTEPRNNGLITLSNNSGRNYYNPEDKIKVVLSEFDWVDAANGVNGATIQNYLISSYSKNRFNFINNEVEITAPPASIDLTITLTLCTDIVYSDIQNTITTPQTITLKIARWTKDAVSIVQVTKQTKKLSNGEESIWLEGFLEFQEGLCSSADSTLSPSSNLKEIIPSLQTEGYQVLFYNNSGDIDTIFSKNELPSSLRIPFKITSNSTAEDFSNTILIFTINFYNTSSKVIEVTTVPYKFFIPEVDMAIRKSRIGINVGEEFSQYDKDGQNQNKASSTLQINAGPQNDANVPIVEIFSTKTDSEVSFISFSKSGSLFSRIYSKNDDLIIDKLLTQRAQQSYQLIDETKSNSLIINNGKVVLNNYISDVLNSSKTLLSIEDYDTVIAPKVLETINQTSSTLSPATDTILGGVKVPSANGLSMNGENLTIALANGTTTAGVVSTGAQTFAGIKTFTGTRPIILDSTNGIIKIKFNTSVWNGGLQLLNSSGDSLAMIGGKGTGNALEYLYFGTATAPWLKVTSNSTVAATTFIGNLTGIASQSEQLGTNTVGNTNKPIYLNNGKPIACANNIPNIIISSSEPLDPSDGTIWIDISNWNVMEE